MSRPTPADLEAARAVMARVHEIGFGGDDDRPLGTIASECIAQGIADERERILGGPTCTTVADCTLPAGHYGYHNDKPAAPQAEAAEVVRLADVVFGLSQKIRDADPSIMDDLHDEGCAYNEGTGECEDCECPRVDMLGDLWAETHALRKATAKYRDSLAGERRA